MRILLVLGIALISSCSFTDDEEKAPETSATKPVLVGRIALIPPGHDFVLVESYGSWRVPEGGVLTSVGSGGSANLVVTGESSKQHAAADIRSGEPKVGDSVYFRPVKDQEESVVSPSPNVPASPEIEKEPQLDPPESPAKP